MIRDPHLARLIASVTYLALVTTVAACSSVQPTLAPSNTATTSPSRPASPSATAAPVKSAAVKSADTHSARATRLEHSSYLPIETGDPIDLASLSGRIVFDDFENVFAADIDGSDRVTIASKPGPEFDGTWSPDGRWIAYRDSTQGTNNDDEIYVAAADGSTRRNLTNDPANDWGPEWSHDGSTIAFNSTREGTPMSGYLVDPDGSNLRRVDTDMWMEYPSFSPDDSKIAFMGAQRSDYSIYTIDLATGETTQVTDFPGEEGWPSWSPDGSTIAFSTQRDDCGLIRSPNECWSTGDEGRHHDIWLVNADGSDPRRVTPEFGQFVTWSPDGDYLLVSGVGLYVVRPDGTGRLGINNGGVNGAGIPDWR